MGVDEPSEIIAMNDSLSVTAVGAINPNSFNSQPAAAAINGGLVAGSSILPNSGGSYPGYSYPQQLAATVNPPIVRELCRCGGEIELSYEEMTFRLMEEWLSRHSRCLGEADAS